MWEIPHCRLHYFFSIDLIYWKLSMSTYYDSSLFVLHWCLSHECDRGQSHVASTLVPIAISIIYLPTGPPSSWLTPKYRQIYQTAWSLDFFFFFCHLLLVGSFRSCSFNIFSVVYVISSSSLLCVCFFLSVKIFVVINKTVY